MLVNSQSVVDTTCNKEQGGQLEPVATKSWSWSNILSFISTVYLSGYCISMITKEIRGRLAEKICCEGQADEYKLLFYL